MHINQLPDPEDGTWDDFITLGIVLTMMNDLARTLQESISLAEQRKMAVEIDMETER